MTRGDSELKPPGPVELESPSDFGGFYATEYERLFKTMVLMTSDPAEADDLTQTAFMRVFERWDRVRAMDEPVAYLYRIAVNQYRSDQRRIWRRHPRSLIERPADDASEGVIARSIVHEALTKLTSDQRLALVLIDWVGLSSDEAGIALGIEPGAVRARVHRARTRLREELSEHG